MFFRARYFSRAILILLLPLAANPVAAQQLASFSAPWIEEENQEDAHQIKTVPDQNDDLNPRPLTLADLQKLGLSSDGETLPDARKTVIETMYSDRAEEGLALFGYDIFGAEEKPSEKIPAGMVQDTYILSDGDEIEIVVKGQENARKTYTINTRGQLVTDRFTTINAAGRTLGDVTKTLQDEASRLHNVEINVALTAPRQINILVIGEVIKPGRKMLTGFHSILDALQEADGIRKTGSLRRIKLVRGGKSEFIDLYSVLMQGGSGADKLLREGDRIIVPPIGPTVAVSGAVKRPAIYEIRKGEQLSTLEMLGMAGSVLAPGSNRFMRLALTSDGNETVDDVSEPTKKLFGDGGLLQVAQAEEKRSENVELTGHTRDPGQHDLRKAKTLSELMQGNKAYGTSLYPLLGVIERVDPKTMTRTLIEFSPALVLSRKGNLDLRESDVVYLFSTPQIRALGQNVTKEKLLKQASYKPGDNQDDNIKDELIASFLEERSVFVRGAVRQPGAYPVAAGTSADDLIAAAGGLTVEGDAKKIELTSIENNDRQILTLAALHNSDVAPGDTMRVNQKFNRVEDQSVTLLGEVKHPGKYDLVRGDTMSSLINRAGGLTTIAYPDGTIFSRASERKQEESRYKAQARDLELKLAAMMQDQDKDKKPDMEQVSAAQSVISQLKDARAVGRITVESDPGILENDPEQDILLEGGDKIYIPRRPLTVRVGGEVLSPAALQFRKGKEANAYIDQAGGTTYYADRDRAFVVYPDGSASPLSVSMWKHNVNMIPPGSTIIVPRDPKPFSFLEGAETVTTILANIALTGFYLDDLGGSGDDD